MEGQYPIELTRDLTQNIQGHVLMSGLLLETKIDRPKSRTPRTMRYYMH